MSNSEYKYDVFLSFSHKDSEKAKQVWNTLTKSGIRVFFAEEELKKKIGRSFIEVISTALMESNHFLLIHSDHAYKSAWVQEESETFFNECYLKSNRERKIVLFAEGDFQLNSIPPFYRKLQVSTEIEQVISMLGGSSLSSLVAKNKSLNEEVDYLTSKIKSLEEQIVEFQSQSTSIEQENNEQISERIIHKYVARRQRLPQRRSGFSQEALIGGAKVELITKEWNNQQLGSILLRIARESASFTHLLDAFSEAVTLGLQYGVPLEEFVDTFVFTKFEPSGMVNGSPHVKMTTSILDYVFRELAITYLGRDDLAHVPPEELIIRPLLPSSDEVD